MKPVYLLVHATWILGLGADAASAQPFELALPNVNSDDFRVTTFATGLDFPVGMRQLPDGSLLVSVSRGQSFWGATGQLVRFVDADDDGVADAPGTVLASGIPGGLSSLEVAGELVFTMGQNQPITVLRMGATPAEPLERLGFIRINLPGGGWLHPHSTLRARETPDRPGSYDLFFQLGSDTNFAPTTRTATLVSDFGLSGELHGDALYKVTLTLEGEDVVASDLEQIATGLRNAAGLAFHPVTGDLYLQDNGIDGLRDPNEPHSADELNVIPLAEIGGAIEDFGFPRNYTAYRTGEVVGGEGIQPLVAFQPVPDPETGHESEGPAEIAFAPPGFPEGLSKGIFVGFHGKFSLGGRANEENPLVFVDLETLEYFHVIGVDEPRIGHLDGLLSTGDALFVSDITSTGNLGSGGGRGSIYMIKAVSKSTGGHVVPGDCNRDGTIDLSDGLCILGFLFGGAPDRLPCGDGAVDDPANVVLLDWNGDGGIDLTDGVGVLAWLFSGGAAHPAFTDADGDERPDAVPVAGCPPVAD